MQAGSNKNVSKKSMPAGDMITKILVVADGEPTSSKTNSGVAKGILSALQADERVEVIGAISSIPPRWVRFPLLILTFRQNRSLWKNEYRKSRLATVARSITRDLRLRSSGLKPDVILHVRNTYLPSRFSYINFIDNTSSLSNKNWEGWKLSPRSAKWRFEAERRQFEKAKAVFTASKEAANSVVADYAIDSNRVLGVGGGTNIDAPIDTILRSNDRRSHDVFKVLFVGIDFERKGGLLLLEAFHAFAVGKTDVHLTIAGPDLHIDSEQISCVGRVDRSEIERLYSTSTVFCLPSLYEPYGLVVQEAMASELAVVVSDIGALPDIVINDLTGIVTRHGVAEDIADAFERLYANRELGFRLGKAASRSLDEMTWSAVADRMIRKLESL